VTSAFTSPALTGSRFGVAKDLGSQRERSIQGWASGRWSWARTIGSVRSRSQLLGPDSRPVALPGVEYDRSKVRSAGLVILPLHIRWSDPVVQYDLEDPRDLRRVYEQVLREGTPEDIQEFIDVDRLCDLWDDLVLPSGVRRRWASWLGDNRGVFVRC
jgi:hypothetical protein